MNQKMAIKIYEGTLLVSRLAMLNLSWFLMTVLGAGIFGFLPATLALVAVFRRYYQDKGEFKWLSFAWRTYWVYLRKLFGVSFVFSLIGLSLFLSWLTLGQQHIILNSLIFGVGIYCFFLVIPYFAVNETHFALPLLAQIKNSLLLPFFWGFSSLKVCASFLAMGVLCYLFPGLIIFFSLSVPLYLSSGVILTRWQKQLEKIGDKGGNRNVEMPHSR